MTIDRHHYKYIHIESSNHKSGNDFRVKVAHGLNACTRVALQNFSIPNTIGNTYGALSKLYWVEFMKDNATSGVGDWSAKLFYIDLSDAPSYTQNAEIATFINDKLQNEVYDFDTKTVGTHSFGAEDPLEINFVYDESNYSFSYTVSQTTLTQGFQSVNISKRRGSMESFWLYRNQSYDCYIFGKLFNNSSRSRLLLKHDTKNTLPINNRCTSWRGRLYNIFNIQQNRVK